MHLNKIQMNQNLNVEINILRVLELNTGKVFIALEWEKVFLDKTKVKMLWKKKRALKTYILTSETFTWLKNS